MTDFMSSKDLNVYYNDGANHAIKDANLTFDNKSITALIGPSGCGKSTYLRSLNLMNREIPGCSIEGEILIKGKNINTKEQNVYELRKNVGMVFQQPNPFFKSIRENIIMAPKRHGITDKKVLNELVETSLKDAFLWDEVKDKLDESAYSLSGGQQQRLCIARTLAMGNEIILFDEPCSALDPISTMKIEDLLMKLSETYCIIIVTHNMEQARRISDKTAFFYLGEVVEFEDTEQLFGAPKDPRLQEYLSGEFG